MKEELTLGRLGNEWFAYSNLVPMNKNNERIFHQCLRFGQYILNNFSVPGITDDEDSKLYNLEDNYAAYCRFVRIINAAYTKAEK